MRLKAGATGCILVVGLFLLTGCGGGSSGSASGTGTSASGTGTSASGARGEYPVVVQRNFLNACEPKANGAICRCELSHIEARISLHDFVVADQAIRAGTGKAPSWLIDAAKSCANQ
jgi:hypothetical protein